jgi:hypothetical protein
MGCWGGTCADLHQSSLVYDGVQTWDAGWQVFALQYSQYASITFSRNGQELGAWLNNGRWGGPQNFLL